MRDGGHFITFVVQPYALPCIESMKNFLLIVLAIIGLASCNINRNLMFRTDVDYAFDTPADSSNLTEYRISPNDIVTMRIFSNRGAEILNATASPDPQSSTMAFIQFPRIDYFVEVDGTVELPELGYVEVSGMTIREAEKQLEKLYGQIYRDPFVLVRVTNNRVFVFPGSGGEASVVTLANNNTTLIEALALAGGIQQRGDARKVKVLRQVGDRREVYQVDLSTIEGKEAAGMIVQANDIIYVDPVPRLPAEVLRDVSPIVTLISSLTLVVALVGGIF
jgi:polysaccharide export outer membrane protein